ncbi:hypothetical protein ANANG_G00089820 [Anguilla anguilla]|uniref:Uncharacterized protein n=1 Tax=Anguilla anguilla TaxID=7936 RepID=A0A9D3MNP4_ANGAN|nr:hypothetical protein ANANG_G00089820 [Anguilla anguilla]
MSSPTVLLTVNEKHLLCLCLSGPRQRPGQPDDELDRLTKKLIRDMDNPRPRSTTVREPPRNRDRSSAILPPGVTPALRPRVHRLPPLSRPFGCTPSPALTGPRAGRHRDTPLSGGPFPKACSPSLGRVRVVLGNGEVTRNLSRRTRESF